MNAMMLYPLIPRVGEHNMGTIRGVERMGRVRGVERMEKVRGAIGEIKKTRW